jgi:hypothetical protein
MALFLVDLRAVGVEAEAFGEDALVMRGLPDFLADLDWSFGRRG